MKKEFNIGVSRCARCDSNHDQLEAKSFTKPIRDDNGELLATHFAMCPSTSEPILVLSIQKAK